MTIEVYADADEVELLQDGRVLGREPIRRFSARFETAYAPGELVAVAFRDGAQTGRSSLRTADGATRLAVTVDGAVGDVAFVTVELVDTDGTLHTAADRVVDVTIDGPGVLQGLGSSAPASEESFLQRSCATYRGRALAVVRPTGPGAITVTVTAPGCEPTSITCIAEEP